MRSYPGPFETRHVCIKPQASASLEYHPTQPPPTHIHSDPGDPLKLFQSLAIFATRLSLSCVTRTYCIQHPHPIAPDVSSPDWICPPGENLLDNSHALPAFACFYHFHTPGTYIDRPARIVFSPSRHENSNHMQRGAV